MTEFDNILFDLDGTISDSYEGITKSVAYALTKLGIAPPADRNELRAFIGPPLWDSFSKYYGLDKDGAAQAVKFYREYYGEFGMLDCELYDGIKDVLRNLKAIGKNVILATSKPEVAAVKITEHFGLTQYFDFQAGASSDTSRVKKSDVIAYAVKSTGIDPARSLMVGDRVHDAEGAAANGMACMGVLYGYGSERELKSAGVRYMAATPRDVFEIIKSL